MNGDQWLDEQEAMEIGVKTGFKQGFQAGYTTGYEKGKSLQKAVLDKIRAEIAVLDDADYDFEGYYKAVTDALKIIDKYKAESEVDS